MLFSFFIVWLCINLVCSIPDAALKFPRENAGKVSQKCHSACVIQRTTGNLNEKRAYPQEKILWIGSFLISSIEAVKNDWSLSQLKRQYGSSLYEQLALSTNKNNAVVEMTLPEDNTQIFASKYETVLPSKEELQKLLEELQKLLEEQLAE